MIIFIVTAVAVITASLVYLKGESINESPDSGTDTVPPVVEEGVSKGAVVSSGTAVQAEKYTQLVKDYADRRIQFDMACQAIPPNTTYKNNTKIMFDNRSGDARIITIGGVKYNFTGYGYKILNISGNKLPAKVSFDCGGAVNVGSILIQK